MLSSFAAFWLALAPPASAPEAEPASESEPDLSEAQRLFDEGTARYDAADFAGAIEVFTLALSELRSQGVSDFRIRGLLLFNIGRTHMRAFEIDQEVEHLRQAKSIFTSFVDEAEDHPDEVDAADIEEAKAKLVEIEGLLAPTSEPAADTKPARERKPKRDRPEPTGDPKKVRALGIGLTASGVVVLGGGVGMMVFGAGFGDAAQRQVAGLDDLDLPVDSPAFADADAFVAAERRKGSVWLGVGGFAIGAGVAVLSFGIRKLVTAKRIEKNASKKTVVVPTAGFGSEGAWFGVAGRF